jgi:hypothetical protein
MFFPDADAVIPPKSEEAELVGASDCDLRCGEEGELLLRNFTIQEAQHYFGMKGKRVVIKCPTCGRYNLLAPAVEERPDGSFVTLPRG